MQVLADRISGYVQAYTCYGSVRPFGISSLLAGVDKTGPRLFCIEPSGVFYGYRATAVGKGKALAKTELEKVLAKEEGEGATPVTVRQGVLELARMYVGRSSCSSNPCSCPAKGYRERPNGNFVRTLLTPQHPSRARRQQGQGFRAGDDLGMRGVWLETSVRPRRSPQGGRRERPRGAGRGHGGGLGWFGVRRAGSERRARLG